LSIQISLYAIYVAAITETSISIEYPENYQTIQSNQIIYVQGQLSSGPPNAPLEIVATNTETWDAQHYKFNSDEDGYYDYTLFQNIHEPSAGQWVIHVSFKGNNEYSLSTTSIAINIVKPSDTETEPTKTSSTLNIRAVPLKSDGDEVPRFAYDTYVNIVGSLNPPIEEAEFSYQLTYPDGSTSEGSFNEKTGFRMRKGDYRQLYNYVEGGIVYQLFKIKRDTLSGEYTVNVEFIEDSQHYGSSSVAYFTIEPGMGSSPIPSRCFISTAAFNSKMESAVDQMRSLRDNKVRSSFTGKNFVNIFLTWYYSWSPLVVSFITQSDGLRSLFRVLLIPLFFTMRVSERVFDLLIFEPELASILSILTSALLCGVFYITPLLMGLNLIGRRVFFDRRLVLFTVLSLFFLSLSGSLVESITLNTISFGLLAILVSISTACEITRLSHQLLNHNR
jgi:hypothetical protein